MGVVYLRTNLITGMQYVGQSKCFKNRERDWRNFSRIYANDIINNDRKKYGLSNFTVEILKECDESDELNKWERYYIKVLNTKYPNGYNMGSGGAGCSGWKMPDEQKNELSESRKGENNPMYGVSPWNTGKKMTKEFSEAVSKGLKGKTKGRPKSEEHKKKIGLAHAIPVIQVLPNGDTIEWISAAEAGRNGYNFSHICACCRGERKKHKNCKWYYKKC